MESVKPLFCLGQIVSTPEALDALARANQQPHHFLNRHVTGDWGAELSEEDKAENEYSMHHGFRIFSSYKTAAGEKLWLITEADRSVTIAPTRRILTTAIQLTAAIRGEPLACPASSSAIHARFLLGRSRHEIDSDRRTLRKGFRVSVGRAPARLLQPISEALKSQDFGSASSVRV